MSTPGYRTGRDGRSYRSTPLTRQERGAAIRLSHRLVCERGLSIRGAQQVMSESGTRRSRGAIEADLANYECPRCADRTPGQLNP